jgi:hypothetical protein
MKVWRICYKRHYGVTVLVKAIVTFRAQIFDADLVHFGQYRPGIGLPALPLSLLESKQRIPAPT